MNQVINLTSINTEALHSNEQKVKATSGEKHDNNTVSEQYEKTLEVLARNNPQKITFTIEEVADHLGVSKEFIRRRIKTCAIAAVYFGDKPMIHITELSRISIEGVL